MSVHTYSVSGMSCSHCEISIKEEVGEIPNVQDVQVDFHTGRLSVAAESEIDDAAVLAAVVEAGYQAIPVLA